MLILSRYDYLLWPWNRWKYKVLHFVDKDKRQSLTIFFFQFQWNNCNRFDWWKQAKKVKDLNLYFIYCITCSDYFVIIILVLLFLPLYEDNQCNRHALMLHALTTTITKDAISLTWKKGEQKYNIIIFKIVKFLCYFLDWWFLYHLFYFFMLQMA